MNVCEVCGEPAIGLIQDGIELEPAEGLHGVLCCTFQPLGEPHLFCTAHHRPSMTTWLPLSRVEQIDPEEAENRRKIGRVGVTDWS